MRHPRLPAAFAAAALALAAAALAGAEIARTGEPAVVPVPAPLNPYPVTEHFPVEPGVNTERGFAVAVEGDWLAMGAHLDDGGGEDAGAVYLFRWSGTTWDPRGRLSAGPPRPGARFGLSLALRDGVLAVGAPGEGAVHVFAEDDGVWVLERRLPEGGVVRGFGRSLAFDGNRLAVGAVEPHGGSDGAVYVYSADSWTPDPPQPIRPRVRQTRERFGSAVALAGAFLAVGAPGYDAGTAADAGAVYVFRRGLSRWRERERLLAPNAAAGEQLGAAVATDGSEIFAGAPTADLDGGNSGAVYRFVREGESWARRGPLHVALTAGDQLGFSLALSGDLLAAGAPAPPPAPRDVDRVRVFRRTGGSWSELLPHNSEDRDLSGVAVAVHGERVVAGGVLGDQGGAAAGAAWSFRCPAGDGCTEEAEAVVRDPLAAGRSFGVSVALTESLLAVGAPEGDEASPGAVYVSRRAGDGWRQEERLTSPYPGDGFGSSVALAGSLLAIGAPRARSLPVSPPRDLPNGSVDLFVRSGSSWTFEAALAPPAALASEAAFGASVAIDDGIVAVGAPGGDPGAVHLFEKGPQGWTEIRVLTSGAEGFGAAVSLRDGTLAIGAPDAGDGTGALFVSIRDGSGWSEPQPLSVPRELDDSAGADRLGSSVSVSGGTIAVGAPDFRGGDGAVFLFDRASSSWTRISALADRRFGASVALLGDRLVVGALGQDATGPDDLDRAAVFERRDGAWTQVADLDALQPPHGDGFGAAVALSEGFIVVASPGPARGDRVTVFALPQEDR